MFDTFKKYKNQGDGFLWGIRLNNALIGFVGVMDLEYKPSVFYAMHPKFRHKGYMQESVLAIMNYLFSDKFCYQLETEVKYDNLSSRKLLEKVGFAKTGNANGTIQYIFYPQ